MILSRNGPQGIVLESGIASSMTTNRSPSIVPRGVGKFVRRFPPRLVICPPGPPPETVGKREMACSGFS